MFSFRKWCRFSSRGVLAVTAVLAVYCAITVRTWHRHKAAVDAIVEHGGTFAVKYDGPKWIQSFFASDRGSDVHEYFYNLTRVNFGAKSRGLETYRSFDAETLALMVTHMNAFSNFHILSLSNSTISDDGLQALLELHYIDELELVSTNVSDAGLLYIAQIKELKHLDLRQTNVTPSGVAKLRAELPKCRIMGP